MTDERMIPPEILPPSEDGVFQSLLTHPDAKPILLDVIASALLISVTDVEVRSGELPISDLSQKRERFDVNAKTDSGEQIDVEMQSDAMKGDTAARAHANIKNRAIFNLCDLHASQPGRGIRYDKLLRSFQITFCGYTVFPGREDFVNRFSFRNESGEELLDAVGIVFIELSKIAGILKKPDEDMTDLELWSVFFAVGDKPEYRERMARLTARKEEIKLASALLTNISNDPAQVARYLSRRKFQMDMDHDRLVTFDEGKTEGKAEGERAKAIDIAKRMLLRNRPIEEIMEDTGLSQNEIQGFRDSR